MCKFPHRPFGFGLYPTIAEALRCGGDSLAVDGVVIIAEHGDYPFNQKGQHLYPRAEFFEQVVTQETKRALAAVDDPERIVPWLDTGRFPHDGDPMSSRDLKMLLDTAEAAGLRRFNYHHQGNLSAGEWVVISDKCGNRWNPRTSDYQPPDALVL